MGSASEMASVSEPEPVEAMAEAEAAIAQEAEGPESAARGGVGGGEGGNARLEARKVGESAELRRRLRQSFECDEVASYGGGGGSMKRERPLTLREDAEEDDEEDREAEDAEDAGEGVEDDEEEEEEEGCWCRMACLRKRREKTEDASLPEMGDARG